MKKFERYLLFFISVISIAISLCMLSLYYTVPFITEIVREYLIIYPWFNYIISVFCLLLCICSILLLLISIFVPSKLSAVIIKKNAGKLIFSKQSLESTVRYSYADFDDINLSQIKIKLNRNPEKTKIYVKFSLKDPSKLVDLTTSIQEKIEASIKASFGITIKMIYLEVCEVDPDKKGSDEKSKNMRVE